MSVSIIIPVVNEYPALLKLIPALLQEPSEQVEILVCDGGSSDLSSSYIKQLRINHPSVQWLNCALGRATQMNAGAQQANHDYLLFLHADTALPAGWLNLMAEKPWGRFDVRLSGEHFMFRVIERMMNWRSCWTQVATGDQAIFVQKTLFHQVGGFPDIPLMEDIALSKKLRQKYAISCIKTPLMTSSRRWEQQGVFKTIALMWRLRLAYFFGVSAHELVKVYYPNRVKNRHAVVLQVFSKIPIEGFVKTRLIPHVGATVATKIHRHLLQHNLKLAQQSQLKSELWIAKLGSQEHGLASDRENEKEFSAYHLKLQQGHDLGEKMAHAIQQGLTAYKKVILMGTDCLDLTPEHLQQTIEALDDVDVVLTPVADGGFILIACRIFDAQMFDGVAWGTERALADVLDNVQRLSLDYHLLKPVRDIDTYDDVLDYPELIKLTQ